MVNFKENKMPRSHTPKELRDLFEKFLDDFVKEEKGHYGIHMDREEARLVVIPEQFFDWLEGRE
jgi:hypothetical protein